MLKTKMFEECLKQYQKALHFEDILENVKNLTLHDHGKTFQIIKNLLQNVAIKSERRYNRNGRKTEYNFSLLPV